MLKVQARKLGNVVFLCLQGHIVNGDTETLRDAVHFQSAAESDVSTIVLDLALVSTIDAGGLGVMLELREQVQAKGIDFKLMNVSKLVYRVLEITPSGSGATNGRVSAREATGPRQRQYLRPAPSC